MVLPSKTISMNTSEMSEKVPASSRSIRNTRTDGMDPETQPLIYPRMYAYVADLGSGEHECC